MKAQHWSLIQSGQILGRYSTIKECLDIAKARYPMQRIQGSYITDQMYEIKVLVSPPEYFTVLWRLSA